MTTKYADELADALADITEAGAVVTFPGAVPGTAGTHDPATDTWGGGTAATDATGRGIEIPGDPDTYRTLSLIQSNPVTLLLAASGVTITPRAGMPFVWPAGGTPYTVRLATPMGPDGTPILWTLVGSG